MRCGSTESVIRRPREVVICASRSSSAAAPSGPPRPMLLRTISTVSNRPSDASTSASGERPRVLHPAAARDVDGQRRLVDGDHLAAALLQQQRHAAGGAADVEHAPAGEPQHPSLGRRPATRRVEVVAAVAAPDGAVVALHDLGGVAALQRGEQDRAVGVLVRRDRHSATLHAGTTESPPAVPHRA